MRPSVSMPASASTSVSGGKARDITYAEIGNKKIISEIAGNNRHIIVTEDTVFVGSSGISSGSWFGKKVKRYPIDSITSVDVRKALLTVELELVMGGGSEMRDIGSGFMDRARNENITMFQKSQYNEVQQIATLILDLRHKRKAQANNQPTRPSDSTNSIPKQIKELAELRDAGIITPEEFEEKKKELLRRM
jgi:hypothetical protein